jgi:hypothetical protein
VVITAPYASGSVETPIQFALYETTGSQAAIARASIQTEIMLSLSFKMPVPIEASGCYVKYTFPDDMPLKREGFKSNELGLTGFGAPGSPGQRRWQAGVDGLYSANVEQSLGNFITVEGCTNPLTIGPDQELSLRFTPIVTPDAQKETNEFTIEIYKAIDTNSLELSNLMVSTKAKMPKSFLTSGRIVAADFSASVPFIQTAAAHTISFNVPNRLPAKNDFYDSRILVRMPEAFAATDEPPTINALDNNLVQATIARETLDPKCSTGRVCYAITHSNRDPVARGQLIKFFIIGSTNQDSVRAAGDFEI